jgi:hypothetical protein
MVPTVVVCKCSSRETENTRYPYGGVHEGSKPQRLPHYTSPHITRLVLLPHWNLFSVSGFLFPVEGGMTDHGLGGCAVLGLLWMIFQIQPFLMTKMDRPTSPSPVDRPVKRQCRVSQAPEDEPKLENHPQLKKGWIVNCARGSFVADQSRRGCCHFYQCFRA